MAAWRDELQPASFRNVPFFVENAELSGGRKLVVFEFPNRDQPFVEDLGRRARSHRVEAYVVGEDYFSARDALIDALERPGSGTLIHPYQGVKLVAVASFRMQESRLEGGFAAFGIEFVEVARHPFAPQADHAAPALFGASSTKMLVTAQTRFVEGYRTLLPSGLSVPGWSLRSVAQVLTDWTRALRNALSPVVKETQKLSAMKAQLDGIMKAANLLVRTPTSILTQLGLVLHSLSSWPDTPRLGVDALMAAYGFHTSAIRPVGTTKTRAIEQANIDVLTAHLRTISVTQAASFAVDALSIDVRPKRITTALRRTDLQTTSSYDSYEDALAVQRLITQAIDTLADTADDETFADLQQLRADLAAAVPGDPNTLPRLKTYTPPVTLPALVIAQRLYGDIALTDDLVARNAIAHPGFVPGSQPLQVLSHA